MWPAGGENEAELTHAVRLAIDKDPFVSARQLSVSATDRVVTLEALVPTETDREMAECDAWYVGGVEDVVNRIKVRPEQR
ncbi:MAG: BON domain-containing protein [Gammaproteobacteria bacterium]|nr:BON domain-containing protein [Gammaproteobacteria bacterium]NIR88939.1 BON domain-containing protein [Gammaproteobacteria bacterium]NIU05228.1 BON domain-containing protein [Gammaproteobacteria bacterium]NIV52843.1 BON domain-containing protein [Gammaproteobacteria bacterium]NIW85139.1 BON domain-containing protein [Gammaproteobacteria bacterium]